jgi:hypothetical protein
MELGDEGVRFTQFGKRTAFRVSLGELVERVEL